MVVDGCEIYGNAYAGIKIRDYANPDIKNCYIHHGKRCGIWVCNYGRGNIMDCQISENASFGIVIEDNGHSTIGKNRFKRRNAFKAIYIDKKSGGRLESKWLYFSL